MVGSRSDELVKRLSVKVSGCVGPVWLLEVVSSAIFIDN